MQKPNRTLLSFGKQTNHKKEDNMSLLQNENIDSYL